MSEDMISDISESELFSVKPYSVFFDALSHIPLLGRRGKLENCDEEKRVFIYFK